jgi:hypothetical protein
MEQVKESKKEKMIVIISTVILVLVVLGSAFAYYYANFIGTSENELVSGKLELNFANEKAMVLSDQKPVTDAVGTSISDDDAYTFDVVSTINGDAILKYDLGLDIISNEGVTSDDVKINLLKKYTESGTEKQEYIIGTATTGVAISSLQSKVSSNGFFNEFVLDDGIFTKTDKASYVLKAWVSGSENDIKLNTEENDMVCSDTTYTTEATCKSAGEVWGSSHSVVSSSNTNYQFKVKIKGEQVAE